MGKKKKKRSNPGVPVDNEKKTDVKTSEESNNSNDAVNEEKKTDVKTSEESNNSNDAVNEDKKQRKRTRENNYYNFKPLSPIADKKIADDYAEVFNRILDEDYVGNVAITGDLGIGKSSAIRSFDEYGPKEKKRNFAYISACDLSIENSRKEKREYEEIQNIVEQNLLIQLVALCSEKDIPRSKYKNVPENTSRKKVLFGALFSGIYTIAILIFFLNDKKALPIPLLNKVVTDDNFLPIFFVLTALAVAFITFSLINNYRVSKISFTGGNEKNNVSADIERNEITPSNLNTDIHELIYILERLGKKQFRNKKAVFVFEDFDRYPSEICIPIFTKLKQINVMINERTRYNDKKSNGKKYQFWFVLKEDIFAKDEQKYLIFENDKYKFFDLVVPITPTVSFGNVVEYLKEIFGEYYITEEFLSEISPFLYDRRTINDVYNEFIIIENKCKAKWRKLSENDRKEKYETLFAFVLYKIFNPKEYYDLFHSDEQYVVENDILFRILIGLSHDGDVEYSSIIDDILAKKLTIDILDFMNISPAKMVELQVKCIKIATSHDETKECMINIDQYLSNANLEKRYLKCANMKCFSLSGINLKGADLSGADLRKSILKNAKLNNANLENAKLKYSNLSNSILENAKLNNAYLRFVNFNSANLSKAKLNGASIIDCDFSGADLNEADFSGADLRGTFLSGAKNLEQAKLEGAKYLKTGDLLNRATTFPNGFKPNKHGMIEVDRDGNEVK